MQKASTLSLCFLSNGNSHLPCTLPFTRGSWSEIPYQKFKLISFASVVLYAFIL
jgi:hypothetical protein